MLEEMQREIDEMRDERKKFQNNIKEMEDKYNQSIRNTVDILRSIGLPDEKIISRLCTQYQFEETQARQ